MECIYEEQHSHISKHIEYRKQVINKHKGPTTDSPLITGVMLDKQPSSTTCCCLSENFFSEVYIEPYSLHIQQHL